MVEYEDKNDSFEFEKYICFEKPELWRNEAYNLFASAQVLFEFSNIKTIDVFDEKKRLDGLFSDEISNRSYWYYRVIRMLWGYGLENILKGIIIIKYKINNPQINEVPINEIKSHNLKSLLNKADFIINEETEFYIGIIEKCSVWCGRYPLPTKSTQMYEQRKPMSSSEELNKRSIELHSKFMNGEIPRTFCESDILHGGIGSKEYEIIKELISNLFREFESLNTQSN